MYGKEIFRFVGCGLILLGGIFARSQAAPPWVNLVSFNRVEADPDKDYALTENHGPYLIMACSFSGEGAEKQAQDLVLELRKRYKLPAYLYKKTIQLTQAQGRGFDSFGEPVRMKYRAGDRFEEVAVMVGEYAAVDDSEAQRTLKKIKYAKPKCLELTEGEATNQTLAGWREMQGKLQEAIGSKMREKGPMGHAMITSNPLLPPGFFAQKALDPFLVELNKDLEYSLLNCPGKFTVQVATFKGHVEIKPDKIAAIQSGKEKIKGGLVDAANKATQLTQALRIKGYEAYEFHDRNASIVTVGSFNSVGSPLPDGRIELDPKILAIMKTFGAKPVDAQLGDEQTLNTAVKSLAGINFDVQPIPVQAPKASLSASLNRGRGEVERIDFRE
ncbi:MAG: hypothetical protein IT426_07940 [Pirellulales bacterium]|nr:hypothetical protein [Pirellulales bacterium]